MRKSWLIIGVVLVLLVVVLACIPQITSITTVSMEDIVGGKHPALLEEWNNQKEQYELIPLEEALIVSVSSLLGETKYSILPCLSSSVSTAPEYNQTNWYTQLCLIQVRSGGNSLLDKLCRLRVENVSVLVSAGDQVYMSDTGGDCKDVTEFPQPEEFQNIDVPSIAVTPLACVTFYTSSSIQSEGSKAQSHAGFTWNFDINLCGRNVYSCREFRIDSSWINNA